MTDAMHDKNDSLNHCFSSSSSLFFFLWWIFHIFFCSLLPLICRERERKQFSLNCKFSGFVIVRCPKGVSPPPQNFQNTPISNWIVQINGFVMQVVSFFFSQQYFGALTHTHTTDNNDNWEQTAQCLLVSDVWYNFIDYNWKKKICNYTFKKENNKQH